MEDPNLLRSRAEIAFAELLVRDPELGAAGVRALCHERPELAAEVERMHREWLALRSLAPAGGAVAAPLSDLPRELGGYRCLRLLGRGGMAEVWEAEDTRLGRRVALKLLPPFASSDETMVERFQREAQAAGRVQHPAIVAVYEAGEAGGRRYIAQELVPGGRSLRDALERWHREGELPADHDRAVARLFLTLARALAAAHAAGVVHRDLKPQNVLLAPDGEPKLADFGLALLEGLASLSRTGEFLGTYLYASPEQVDASRGGVDARSDLFSLGATLYECLTLRRPFDGDSVREITSAITSEDPEPPHRLRRRIPPELSWICMKLLEKRPEQRYATMEALARDLERFLAKQPVSVHAPSLQRRCLRWAERHPARAVAWGVGVSAFLAVLGLFLRSEHLRGLALRAQRATDAANLELECSNTALSQANEELRESREAERQSAEQALQQARSARRESEVRQQVLDFVVSLFRGADPLAEGLSDVPARELVERGAQRIDSATFDDPGVRPRLQATIASVYAMIGGVEESRALYEKAVAYWRERGELDSPEGSAAQLGLASSVLDVGAALEGEELLQPLLARWRERADLAPELALQLLQQLTSAAQMQQHYSEARAYLDEADRIYEEHLQDHPELLCPLRDERAWLDIETGELERAEELLRAEIERRASLFPEDHPERLESWTALATLLSETGRGEEAEAIYQDALERIRASLGEGHPLVAVLSVDLAQVWLQGGRLAEAAALIEPLLGLRLEAHGPLDAGVFLLENLLGLIRLRQGRPEEAERIYRQLAQAMGGVRPDSDPRLLAVRNNLASALYALGRRSEAITLLEQVLDLTSPEAPELADRQARLAAYRAAQK